MSDITFADLQKITSYEELREAHNAAGVFLVKRNGKAHSSMTCSHNEDTEFVNNPMWRIATDVQVRQLGYDWCPDCDR